MQTRLGDVISRAGGALVTHLYFSFVQGDALDDFSTRCFVGLSIGAVGLLEDSFVFRTIGGQSVDVPMLQLSMCCKHLRCPLPPTLGMFLYASVRRRVGKRRVNVVFRQGLIQGYRGRRHVEVLGRRAIAVVGRG